MEPDEDAGKKKNEEKPVPTGASSSKRAAKTKTDFEMEPDEDSEKKKNEEKPVPTGASSSKRAAIIKTDFEMEPDEDAGKKKNEEKPALKRSRGKWRAAEDESEEEDIPKKKRTLKKAAPKKATELCEQSTNLGIISEKMAGRSGHHECQVLSGLRPEAEECEGQWRNCQKNPGHLNFLPAPDFINNLTRVNDERQRKRLKSLVDLAVKLRVGYTSLGRPDGFTFSEIRGKYAPRVGTGFIKHVWGPEDNEPCKCHGRKQWGFDVATALHVVYDDDEALKTVTVGELRYEEEYGNEQRHYTTPTCPGSSGAPVFQFDEKWIWLYLWTYVHNGSFGETCPEPCDRLSPVQQLNYGHRWI